MIENGHQSYLEAGCDIITTSCSYQASIQGFQKHFNCTLEDSEFLLKECLMVGIRSRDNFCLNSKREIYVAISIGSYGASLADGSEYSGNYSERV